MQQIENDTGRDTTDKEVKIEDNSDGEYDYKSLDEFLKDEETAKLMPDLDFKKVKLNKRQQFLSFCKIYSVFTPDSELMKTFNSIKKRQTFIVLSGEDLSEQQDNGKLTGVHHNTSDNKEI